MNNKHFRNIIYKKKYGYTMSVKLKSGVKFTLAFPKANVSNVDRVLAANDLLEHFVSEEPAAWIAANT